MKKMSLVKAAGIFATVAGFALQLLSDWADEKKLDAKIDEKLAEREKEKSNG